MRRWMLLGGALALATAGILWAHGGRTDGQGGHRQSSTGTYHFHSGPLDGNSYGSKSAATRALVEHEVRQEQKAKPAPAKKEYRPGQYATFVDSLLEVETRDRLNALERLLIKKGLITEAELVAEMSR